LLKGQEALAPDALRRRAGVRELIPEKPIQDRAKPEAGGRNRSKVARTLWLE
jgi:hypothetical protein